MAHFEKMLTKEKIYDGKVVHFSKHTVELENGKTATREVITHGGAVAVVAIDDADNLLLVSQFRYSIGQEMLEIPAGKLELGEDPLACGKRELLEETGYHAEDLRLLTTFYPTPAYCTELIHIYYTDKLTAGEACPDADEFVTLVKIPFVKAMDMVLRGEIQDGKTQAAIAIAYTLWDKQKAKGE